MGKQIYFSNKEIQALRDAASEWCSIMGEGEETFECVGEALENGLGSALYKLYKGCVGARAYEEYANK